MDIRKVTVPDMLCARDERALRQQQLLADFHAPIVSFTMNIAGEVKVNNAIVRAFREGQRRIRKVILALQADVLYCTEKIAFTGCECLWAVKCDAQEMKKRLCEMEDMDDLGRLFDMDVMDADGAHLGRTGERSCLICGKPVRACARSRVHGADELFQRSMEIMNRYFADAFVSRVGERACRALLTEAYTTPKPGLVDRENSGAHRDMALCHFEQSARMLEPYFEDCVRLGMEKCTPKELQKRGLRAEEDMFRAVGVNTHKGAIFSLGILCCAMGRRGEGTELDTVLSAASELGRYYLDEMKAHNPMQSGGERQYALLGLTGARGEAADGFGTVKNVSLPALEKALEAGCDLLEAGLSALLHLMCVVPDSNVLRRGGEAALAYVQAAAKTMVQTGFDHDALRKLNEDFVKRNLSPGGSADLLAVTYFLHFLYGG